MNRIHVALALPLTWTLFASIALADDRQEKFFRSKVEPILVGRCLECHGVQRKGELDLSSKATALKGGGSGRVIEPGKPQDSLLYEYVSTEEMPPKKPLSADEIATLKRWIAEGAYFPDKPLDPFAVTTDSRAGYDWWSLKPLADNAPPRPKGIPEAWTDNPIDRFIYATLIEKGLQPSPPADKRTLIRRATYDLIGLPPTPEAVAAFVKDDRADAYERLIERLLDSPDYGEHWGRHWLDVVRFGESRGFERNEIINNAWPFRDYVIRSFNEDKPFDRLVIEHLAGDVIGAGDPDVEVGTTFLVCGPYDDVGNQDAAQAAQIRANTIDDMIRATSETFLGLTVGCGRCHNHKFDPVRQRDYYSLYATFAGVYHGNRVVATAEQKNEHAAKLKPLNESIEKLAKQKAELENAIFSRAEEKAAYYESRWTRPAVKRNGTEEIFEPIEARFVRLVVEGLDTDPNARSDYRIDEFEVWTASKQPRNVALLRNGGKADGKSRVAEDFADAYSATLTIDGKFGVRWIAAGPQLTITLANPETINRVFFSSDRRMSIGMHRKTTFVGEYRIQVSLDEKHWTEVANSYDRKPVGSAHRRKRLGDLEITADERKQIAGLKTQLADVNRRLAAVTPVPSWWVGTFRQTNGPFHVFVGGNPQRKGDEVVPASLGALANVTKGYQLAADAPEGERRLALAKWLVALENPLTPRVLANRLWHYHFGTGIVDTPSDFGFMGGRPTHPELLDWLAREMVCASQNHSPSDRAAQAWRLKRMHKLIMRSHTYRQSSDYRATAAALDADSRTLWRFPPRRLTGEEIRDTILFLAGKLDTRRGGPGFRLYRYLQDNVATYVPLDRYGPGTYRRAIYHQNARALRVDLMTEFDCPDNAFATPRRVSTTTPLQALTMMNHSFILDMAGFLAQRLQREVGRDDRRALVRRAFAVMFARPPAKAELAAAVRLVEQHGLRAFCRALLNSNELIYIN